MDIVQAKISQLQVQASKQKESEFVSEFQSVYSQLSSSLKKLDDTGCSREDVLKLIIAEARQTDSEIKSKYLTGISGIIQERDTLSLELGKVSSMKGSLEKLCRELQKENKTIREQSLSTLVEEREKREALAKRFESSMDDIKKKMEEESLEQAKRIEAHEKLREQFKTFLEQYEVREKHFDSLIKTKELEAQLAEAKLEQALKINEAQREKIETLESQSKQLVALELGMKDQILQYSEKYKIIEESLKERDKYFKAFEADRDRVNNFTCV